MRKILPGSIVQITTDSNTANVCVGLDDFSPCDKSRASRVATAGSVTRGLKQHSASNAGAYFDANR